MRDTKPPNWQPGQIVVVKIPPALKPRFANSEVGVPARILRVSPGVGGTWVYALQHFPPRHGAEPLLGVRECDIDIERSSRSPVTGRGSWRMSVISLVASFFRWCKA